jgi:hypothetical protein
MKDPEFPQNFPQLWKTGTDVLQLAGVTCESTTAPPGRQSYQSGADRVDESRSRAADELTGFGRLGYHVKF